MRPAKTQISLGRCPDWSVFALQAKSPIWRITNHKTRSSLFWCHGSFVLFLISCILAFFSVLKNSDSSKYNFLENCSYFFFVKSQQNNSAMFYPKNNKFTSYPCSINHWLKRCQIFKCLMEINADILSQCRKCRKVHVVRAPKINTSARNYECLMLQDE